MTENENEFRTWRARLSACATGAVPPALRTGLWMIRITVPISFAVMLLKVTGMLPHIARVFEPLFALFGMPGEAALVFVTAVLVNIYACIGVIDTLGLTGNTVTILALMCLIAHSVPLETAIQKKTGSSFSIIFVLRIVVAFVGAMILYLLLPAEPAAVAVSAVARSIPNAGFVTELVTWLKDISLLCLTIIILITLLMILQRILDEFGVIGFLSRLLNKPLLVLGIPHQAAFLWIVANILGLGYGAGVIIDHVDSGRLSRKHADTLNYHIAISHSLLEDTLLFVAIGASAGWITIPRIILAGVVVWIKRLVEHLLALKRQPTIP